MVRGYEIQEYLGSGAFGSVHRAIRTVDGTTVAIKILRRGLSNACGRRNYEREIESLQSLNHPNIIAYIDSFCHKKKFYIITQFCPRGNLADYLDTHRPLSERRLVLWSRQIVSALVAMKNMNIVHRDLKPDNIFLTSRLNIKIGDFGIAKTLIGASTTYGRTGHPLYAAPELRDEDECYDYQVDVWGFGCVLFEMMTQNGFLDGRKTVVYRVRYDLLVMPQRYNRMKEFVYDALLLDPEERPTIEDIYHRMKYV